MAVTQVDIRHVIDLVYGQHVERPSGEELTAAKRVLEVEGVTTNTVRLMMLIVGTSQRFWAPMFETAAARGWAARKLEQQLPGLQHAVSKDPSAPGNRAGEAAYHETPKTDEDIEQIKTIELTTAQKIDAVQAPWRALIDQAHREGLRGLAMSKRVAELRSKQTGKPPFNLEKMLAGKWLRDAAKAAPRTDIPLQSWELEEPIETGLDDVDNPRHSESEEASDE